MKLNKVKKLIKNTDPYDLVDKLNTVNGLKYRRNKVLMYIERTILYGLYINYDPENFKQIPNRDFYTDFKITDPHYSNPSSIYRNDLKPIFAQWKKLRNKLSFVSDEKVFSISLIFPFLIKLSDNRRSTSIYRCLMLLVLLTLL